MVKNRSIIIKRWIGWHFKTLKGKNTQILFTFFYKTIDEKPNTWSVFLIMWNHYESSAHRCPWWNRNWVTLVSRDVVIRLGHFLTPNFFVCLQLTLPWGTLSSLSHMCPTESDDGPIMWVRPGEQTIPVADVPKSPFKRKRWVSQSFLLHFCMKRPRNNFHKTDILVSAAAVYAGYKSWVLPALLSQRLVLFLAALKDWLWRAEKKKSSTLAFWNCSPCNGVKLCCCRTPADEAITLLPACATVARIKVLPPTRASGFCKRGREWERACFCYVSGMLLTARMRSSSHQPLLYMAPSQTWASHFH